MLSAGNVVAGKFRIDRVIGQGGMGIVVAATHVHLGQRVALKFLLPEFLRDQAVVGRFLREARASAQLRSEHVCRVSDVGTLDTGVPYIVMELLEGHDLATRLAEHGPLPIPMLADYVVQACLGLAAAHAARIVHRDLKPANLFVALRPDGQPLIKLLDFGIAKAPTDANFKLTQTAAVLGSPGYMSPEQLRSSRDADMRSDIWALGVILFELASGRPPFTAESITDLTLRVAMDPTPPLAGVNVPHGFEYVVYRCLEKDPARRFQDVAQLAMALAPFGGPMTSDRALGVARVLSVAPGTSAGIVPIHIAAAPTTLGSSASSLERPRSDGLRWGILVGALAVVAIAAIAFARLRRDDAQATAGSPPHVLAPADRVAAEAAAPLAANAPAPPDAAVPSDAARLTDTSADAASFPDAALRKAGTLRRPPRTGSDDDVDVGTSRH